MSNKIPEKCVECKYRKVFTHYVRPYNFCKKLNVSFSGGEPDSFFNCKKGENYVI